MSDRKRREIKIYPERHETQEQRARFEHLVPLIPIVAGSMYQDRSA
jgi:hypothetical protein